MDKSEGEERVRRKRARDTKDWKSRRRGGGSGTYVQDHGGLDGRAGEG